MANNTQQPMLGEFSRRFFITLVGILLVYVIVLVGTMIRNNIQKYDTIGQAETQPNIINVAGEGKVTVKPDIGTISLGFYMTADTVKDGTEKNNTIINQLVAGLKKMGIADADIQTAGSQVSPNTIWNPTDGTSEVKGYNISQQVTVKVRDLAKAQDVIAFATESGANNVSPLSFSVDEPKNYEMQARKEAVDEAFEKARVLAQQLGVELVRVAGYNEYGAPSYPYYGGTATYDMAMSEKAMNPAVEPGSQDVMITANIMFEVR